MAYRSRESDPFDPTLWIGSTSYESADVAELKEEIEKLKQTAPTQAQIQELERQLKELKQHIASISHPQQIPIAKAEAKALEKEIEKLQSKQEHVNDELVKIVKDLLVKKIGTEAFNKIPKTTEAYCSTFAIEQPELAGDPSCKSWNKDKDQCIAYRHYCRRSR